MTQSPTMQESVGSARTSPAPSLPLISNNAVAGTKRKRVVERKFYAVKEGKSPGIYNTWDECLAQVRGHKGALFKAFQSLHEAQAFVDGKFLSQSTSTLPSEQKFYAVQNGKKPGVYTDWPSAQAQISGFRNPRHKKFNTRAEAEAFVAARTQKELSFDTAQTLSPEEEIRRLIVRNSAPGLVTNGTHQPKDKDGNPLPLGTGPLPPGAEDGFDPNIKLGPDGTIVQKTEAEKARTKQMIKEKEPPGMLRIYTDGSSLRNGQAGARAGVGVFFGPQDPKNVSEALKGSKQTNQRAELTAIQRALDIAPRHRDVTIYTDSKYAIDCVTNWYRNWEVNGWVNSKGKAVENKDIVMDVREQIEEREGLGRGTYFVWVKGHAGDEGNVQADRLAVEGARLGRGISEEADREVDERSGGSGEEDDDEDDDESQGDADGGGMSVSADENAEVHGNGMEDGMEHDEVREAYEAMVQAMSDDEDGHID